MFCSVTVYGQLFLHAPMQRFALAVVDYLRLRSPGHLVTSKSWCIAELLTYSLTNYSLIHYLLIIHTYSLTPRAHLLFGGMPYACFIKIGMRDYVHVIDGTRHAKFCSDRFRGFCSPNTWFCRAFRVTSYFLVLGEWGPSITYTQNGFVRKNVKRRCSG